MILKCFHFSDMDKFNLKSGILQFFCSSGDFLYKRKGRVKPSIIKLLAQESGGRVWVGIHAHAYKRSSSTATIDCNYTSRKDTWDVLKIRSDTHGQCDVRNRDWIPEHLVLEVPVWCSKMWISSETDIKATYTREREEKICPRVN